jgi:thioredoxin reductase (NADPH)
VPGLDELVGTGIFYGAAMTEAAACRGQDVCVVGGANSAGQGALFFSRYARHVTMLVRAESLERAMSRYLVDRIEATPNIDVLTGVEVAAVSGNERLDSVVVRSLDTLAEHEEKPTAMFVFVGSAPHTDAVAELVDLDERGYVLTGPDLPRGPAGRPRGWRLERDPYLFETNVPGVFAVGDVRAGSGKRVAAAVGEGSGTVSMVHRYLRTV